MQSGSHTLMAFNPNTITGVGARTYPGASSGEDPFLAGVVTDNPHRPTHACRLSHSHIGGVAAPQPHIVLNCPPRPILVAVADIGSGDLASATRSQRKHNLATIITHPACLVIVDEQALIQDCRPARPQHPALGRAIVGGCQRRVVHPGHHESLAQSPIRQICLREDEIAGRRVHWVFDVPGGRVDSTQGWRGDLNIRSSHTYPGRLQTGLQSHIG